ncbi:MAG TPA: regulatory protein RecX [Nitrospira sp.]|nr:regulatory protein RecX [Nitrospira sp.]
MNRRIPQSGDQWFRRALQYLARFDRTTDQVRRFLAAKGAPPSSIAQVISRLSALKYLDDRAYAARWIEATLARRPMGYDRLKNELMAKGVAERLAHEAIVEGLEGLDEETLARRALQLKGGGRRPHRRMVSLLRQRGFAEELIERIISDCPVEERAP